MCNMCNIFKRKNNFTICVDWIYRGDVGSVISTYVESESYELYYKEDNKCYIGFVTRLKLDEVIKILERTLYKVECHSVGNTIFVKVN